MREMALSLVQQIVNRSNSRTNFTKELRPSSGVNGRYVVTSTVLFEGKNPSIELGLRLIIADAVDKDCPFGGVHYYNSIGGWMNPDTETYYIGANLHFFNLSSAIRAAKDSEQLAIFDRHSEKVLYLKDLQDVE
jgi:hypothetical protein